MNQISFFDITSNYHGGNLFSREAHRSIASNKVLLRNKVLAYIGKCGLKGATSDEVELALNMSHQTISARITEAKAQGQLVSSGRKRKTRSGRNADVLVLPPTGAN